MGMALTVARVPRLTRFHKNLTHVEWLRVTRVRTMLGIEMGGVR
ncbi:hypothetical protein J2785_007470, partial [Burkholderia ambifaria]|nr:hypothetical protein [Burkholderia ambifaria]